MNGDIPTVTVEWHNNMGRWTATCDEYDYTGWGDSFEEAQDDLLEWVDVNESNRRDW